MNKKFVVYAYSRKDETFYYIGKGCPRRPYGKRKRGINPPADRSRIHILHSNLDENTALDYEKNLIKFYGRKDLGTGLLQNRTDGGEGVSGWIPSEEWRINKSKSMKGELNPFYGRKHSDNTKEILSLKATGRNGGSKNYFYNKRLAGKDNPMFGRNRPDLSERNRQGCPSKGTKWYNNGRVSKRFKPDEVESGFTLGRLRVNSNSF